MDKDILVNVAFATLIKLRNLQHRSEDQFVKNHAQANYEVLRTGIQLFNTEHLSRGSLLNMVESAKTFLYKERNK